MDYQTEYSERRPGLPPSARRSKTTPVRHNTSEPSIGSSAPHYYSDDESEKESQADSDDELIDKSHGPVSLPTTKFLDEDMSKPVLFYGKPDQLEEVIVFSDIQNLVKGIDTESNKCGILASAFRGQALHWLTAELRRNPATLSDYTAFKSRLSEVFGVSTVATTAKAARRLSTITQKGPVQLYAIEFDQIALTLGLSDEVKQANFLRGLKLHVREALVSSNGYDNYNELVAEAARIDTELYSARRARGHAQYGAGKRSDGQLKCHSCGKFGHISKNCRGKRSQSVKMEEF